MKKNYLFPFIYLFLVFTSCEEQVTDIEQAPDRKVDLSFLSANQVQPGRLIVKFSEEPASAEIITRSGTLGIRKLERVFPPAGELEERSRAAGLHLWYVVEYDETVSATRAAKELSALDDIAVIEPVVAVTRNSKGKFKRFNEHDLADLVPAATRSVANDPYLPAQWNFHNTGMINHTIAGADIRLFDAWKVTSGHPEVIVAVVDGGIDYTHQDLSANMWVNAVERDGMDNIDDDNNGYKDDIYGYNFVTGKPVEPTLHGTHVAGTIGAVNNNGMGVSSIAGGNGMPDSGIRLMSCQIFVENDKQDLAATNYYTAAAIKYAADNGAVICQNSWGFDLGTVSYTPLVIQAAIVYFIINAGTDRNGNQVGPMKGGLVVFAAGNDNSSAAIYPAFDANVISVAAMAPDFKKASYSNYSTTVDIIAPGGEIDHDPTRGTTGILSTGGGWDGEQFARNAYYYMDGTSMACPHVSGVAALLVSHYGVGNPGFTPTQLKEKLYKTAYNISIYNPDYQRMLGFGALDAGRALAYDEVTSNPPIVLNPISNQVFTRVGVIRKLMLTDYFAPSMEGDELNYQLAVQPNEFVQVSIEDCQITLITTGYGKTGITVIAIGANGLTAEVTFSVTCSSRTVWPGKERPGFWTGVNNLE